MFTIDDIDDEMDDDVTSLYGQQSTNEWKPINPDEEDKNPKGYIDNPEDAFNQGGQQPVNNTGDTNKTGDSNNQQGDEEEISVIEQFLRDNNIPNPHAIQYEDEDGVITHVDWNDLPAEDQLEILHSFKNEAKSGYTKEEKEFINSVRRSGMSVNDYIKSINNKTEESQEEYDFNQIEDDQMYALDLMARFPDMTDDEVKETIDHAKQNPELYNKQVQALRQTAIQKQEQKAQAVAQEREELNNRFYNGVLDNIEGLTSIGDIEISMTENDMENLAQFILPDDNGVSAFDGMLNDPKNIVKAAWFLQNGDKLMADLQEYIQTEIKAAQQKGYDKGLAEASKKQSSNTHKVVYKQTQKATPQNRVLTIDDID